MHFKPPGCFEVHLSAAGCSAGDDPQRGREMAQVGVGRAVIGVTYLGDQATKATAARIIGMRFGPLQRPAAVGELPGWQLLESGLHPLGLRLLMAALGLKAGSGFCFLPAKSLFLSN